jgi:hypothetical protein
MLMRQAGFLPHAASAVETPDAALPSARGTLGSAALQSQASMAQQSLAGTNSNGTNGNGTNGNGANGNGNGANGNGANGSTSSSLPIEGTVLWAVEDVTMVASSASGNGSPIATPARDGNGMGSSMVTGDLNEDLRSSEDGGARLRQQAEASSAIVVAADSASGSAAALMEAEVAGDGQTAAASDDDASVDRARLISDWAKDGVPAFVTSAVEAPAPAVDLRSLRTSTEASPDGLGGVELREATATAMPEPAPSAPGAVPGAVSARKHARWTDRHLSWCHWA